MKCYICILTIVVLFIACNKQDYSAQILEGSCIQIKGPGGLINEEEDGKLIIKDYGYGYYDSIVWDGGYISEVFRKYQDDNELIVFGSSTYSYEGTLLVAINKSNVIIDSLTYNSDGSIFKIKTYLGSGSDPDFRLLTKELEIKQVINDVTTEAFTYYSISLGQYIDTFRSIKVYKDFYEYRNPDYKLILPNKIVESEFEYLVGKIITAEGNDVTIEPYTYPLNSKNEQGYLMSEDYEYFCR